jgi:hypothetical protein
MILHIDGSDHRWFGDERRHEQIVILDDATREIYYAQLVEAESTRTVVAALREVIETRGVFCSLYSDRAGHFFITPKRGERVNPSRPTQVGRALQELGIRMIPAYSQAGSHGTQLWNVAGPASAGTAAAQHQGSGSGQHIPARGIHCHIQRAVRRRCDAEGSAFVRLRRRDLDWIFSAQ